MPAIFFGHGSPMNALERNVYSDSWREIGQRMTRPKAVLAVSAHWYVRGTAVTAMREPRTIHDFGGFPRALHELKYPAPGDPVLAARVQQLLAPLSVQADQSWGLDHGSWSVLAHVFPGADVPVVQLSMDATRPPAYHYELGRRLAPLRDEGVLLIGSGNIVHNLRLIQMRGLAPPYDWALRFGGWVRDCIQRSDHAPLLAYASQGEDADLSVPTPEHYLPLLYVLGAQHSDDDIRFHGDAVDLASIAMTTVTLGL